MISSTLLRELEKKGIAYKTDLCVKDKSTFRIGGICPLALFPCDEAQLADSVRLLDCADVPLRVVGRASNTLFFDGKLCVALVFTSGACGVSVDGDTVCCGAGAGLVSLSARVCEAGLSGLEFACGIPASVGGAVFMNAGAHGGCIGDVLTHSRAYDRERAEVVELERDAHELDYRSSIYKKDLSLVCLGASFGLLPDDVAHIRQRRDGFLEARRASQPVERFSAGSYFKRPQGDFAGRLIEICGLKGTCVGDAQVSEKHAGFIINRGGATFEDVIRLEELIVGEVQRQTGVLLEREVEIIR